MIKAKGTINGTPIYLMGLSEQNIQLLKEGKPILFDGSEIGISGNVVIMYGETELHIQDELEKAGLLQRQAQQ